MGKYMVIRVLHIIIQKKMCDSKKNRIFATSFVGSTMMFVNHQKKYQPANLDYGI